MTDMYILENGKPVPASDLKAWAEWFEKSTDDRRVALTESHRFVISTVFLGIDHSFGKAEPLLYETCLTDNEAQETEQRSCTINRYPSRELALEGHNMAVREWII